jgi:putative tributyrin esterase
VNIKLSVDPETIEKGTSMASATINYYSHSLSKSSRFNVVFPDSPDAPRPWSVYYLLHGLSDDNTTWSRRTSIERYVLGYPLMVVMPDGGRGWYTNAVDGDACEDDLLKDVIGLIEKDFPVRAERAGRAIGGVSMGGFGAVKLGLKHPELFASVDSQSGVLGFLQHVRESKGLCPEFTRIFGRSPKDGPEDPFHLAKTVRAKNRPALRIVCGDEDSFLAQNQEFHQRLQSLDVAHEYEEHPGTHTWQFWDSHVREAIDFHRRNLEIPDDPEHALLR